MISFFRRMLSSKLVLGLFALIMIAFVITGVETRSPFGGGISDGSDTIAKVGGSSVSSIEITRRAESTVNNAKQQDPNLDMLAFVRQGGVEQTVSQYVSAKAMELFGRTLGITASDKLIDGEIASIPAFYGPTGKFDQATMNRLLAGQRISERQLRDDIAGDAIRRQMLVPIAGAARVPTGLVLPYASLLLEARQGSIGLIPISAIPPGPAPSDAEIGGFYQQNIARFTIPERRAVRYAMIDRERLGPPPAPTEAEITSFYQANAATYGARETRSIAQVILPDQKAADALRAKAAGGADFAQVAAAAGVVASTSDVTREALAGSASAPVAAAVFAATKGAITAPVKADLGWYVIKVNDVKAIANRPLATVRAEIASSLAKQKSDEQLATKVNAIEQSISDGSSFDDVVKANALTVVTTPPVLPNATSPDQPYQAPPELAVLLKPAFQASADDDPTVEQVGAQRYALLKVTKVVGASPAPLARVRPDVVRAILMKRAADGAKRLADAIIAKVSKGMPMTEAFASAGVKLPPVQKAGARQIDLARSQQPVPPPLTMLFSMRKGDVKPIPAPQGQGWYVVHLDQVISGDAATQPGLVEATRGEFGRVLGSEYLDQFTQAVTKQIGVTRNAAAIARLKARLSGAPAAQ